MRGKKGFTLIELVVVIAVLGILAAIGIPRMVESFKISRGHRMIADLRLLDSAIAYYTAQHGEPPTSLEVLAEAPAIIATVPEPLKADFIVKQNNGVEKEYSGATGYQFALNQATNRATYGGDEKNLEFYMYGGTGAPGGGMAAIANIANTVITNYVGAYGRNARIYDSSSKSQTPATEEDLQKIFGDTDTINLLKDATAWQVASPWGTAVFTWTNADPSKTEGMYPRLIPVITYGGNDSNDTWDHSIPESKQDHFKYRVYVASYNAYYGTFDLGKNIDFNSQKATISSNNLEFQNSCYEKYEYDNYNDALKAYNQLLDVYNNDTKNFSNATVVTNGK